MPNKKGKRRYVNKDFESKTSTNMVEKFEEIFKFWSNGYEVQAKLSIGRLNKKEEIIFKDMLTRMIDPLELDPLQYMFLIAFSDAFDILRRQTKEGRLKYKQLIDSRIKADPDYLNRKHEGF